MMQALDEMKDTDSVCCMVYCRLSSTGQGIQRAPRWCLAQPWRTQQTYWIQTPASHRPCSRQALDLNVAPSAPLTALLAAVCGAGCDAGMRPRAPKLQLHLLLLCRSRRASGNTAHTRRQALRRRTADDAAGGRLRRRLRRGREAQALQQQLLLLVLLQQQRLLLGQLRHRRALRLLLTRRRRLLLQVRRLRCQF